MLRFLGCAVNQGRFTAPEVDMNGKHVLITGTSIGGIGYETALGLAGFGAKVYLASRNPEKGEASARAIREKLPQAQVEVVQCDTADLDSVRALAKKLTQPSMPVMDVVVANAGATTDKYAATKYGVEMTFATNALGHHLLSRLVKPKRIVTVTGDAYCVAKGPADPLLKGYGTDAYNRSCLGRLLLASETRRRAGANGSPEIIAVHPGVIATNIVATDGIAKRIMSAAFITPQAGAQSSIFAASCPSSDIPEDKLYFHNKHGWMDLAENDTAKDEKAAAALYDQCEALCGL